MLCAKCHEREATVHFTIVDGPSGSLKKVDFCARCAGPEMGAEEGFEIGGFPGFLKTGDWSPGAMIKAAIGETGRYPLDAYEFVHEAMEPIGGHVSGRGLLEALRDLAVRKFGKRAKRTLAEWNIFRTEDFGEIVFEMIEAGVFSSQPGDSKEDFANGFDFDEAFPE